VSNRGLGRARMFMGALLLTAAVISWATAVLMSPHIEPTAPGLGSVRPTVAVFMRNSAIGTLILCALSGWLLFPKRRPRWPRRDWAIGALIALLVVTSAYQLIWVERLQ
jgi:hypothetical protein